MIDFSLTEEQIALQDMAREFAQNELKPNAAKYDKGDEFPEEIMQKAFEVGFISCEIPSEYGGGGLSQCEGEGSQEGREKRTDCHGCSFPARKKESNGVFPVCFQLRASTARRARARGGSV